MAAPTQENQQVIAKIEASWAVRLQALKVLAATLSKNYIGNQSNNDRDAMIKSSLSRAGSFGEQIYNFFVNGAYPDNIIRNLGPTDSKPNQVKISIESIPTLILDQIAKDISVFWNAFQQRIVAALSRSPSPAIVSDTLALADHLAWSAKSMMDDYLRRAETSTVLSLLEARAHVRLVPYAPLAVIGVPLSAAGYFDEQTDKPQLAKEFLGIPHEFAHYVYWYGRSSTPDELLRELLQKNLSTITMDVDIRAWVEEIFADVVGCLIGGPAVAYSLQEMMIGGRIEDFYKDNGIHPVNSVRPFILTQALRRMKLVGIAEELQNKWKSKLETLDIDKLATIDLSSSNPTDWRFPIFDQQEQAKEPIRLKTLDDVVEQIFKLIEPTPIHSNLRWSHGNDNDVEKLYTEFHNHIQNHYIQPGGVKPLPEGMYQPLSELMPDLGATFANILSVQSQDLLEEAAQKNTQVDWQNPVTQAGKEITKSSSPLEILEDVWSELLNFGGWTTEIDRSPRVVG